VPVNGVKKFTCGDVLECEFWSWKEEGWGKGVLKLANGDSVEGEWAASKLRAIHAT
jgi:hypothetical protein